jgi:DNA-directed RNA polymerase sigma subunit (sigma70/sigma32)
MLRGADIRLVCKRRIDMKDHERRKSGYGVTHTLEETAEIMGITRERVRQIEKQALEKLRRRLKRRYGITSLAGLL